MPSELVLTRLPSPREQDWLAEYYQKQLQAFEKEPATATALLRPTRPAPLPRGSGHLDGSIERATQLG
jgi:hypothetical protein